MRGYAAIGLYAPKTDANVGGAMRAAFCFGVSLVNISGRRFKKYPTDTQKAWRHIPVVEVDDLIKACPFDCIPVAVEITEAASMLPEFTHPERGYYLFGPEDGSLPATIVSRCKSVVKIPTTLCLNLAAAVNVALYDRASKQANPRNKNQRRKST